MLSVKLNLIFAVFLHAVNLRTHQGWDSVCCGKELGLFTSLDLLFPAAWELWSGSKTSRLPSQQDKFLPVLSGRLSLPSLLKRKRS